MVTFTGIECHNEWEITFEEIHRNGAMAYAIFHYTTYTGDSQYIVNEGFDVCGIARFYADRVHFSKRRRQYMIHGSRAPTSMRTTSATTGTPTASPPGAWSFYTVATQVSRERKDRLGSPEELARMREIVAGMYYPQDEELGVFVQHDTFLDKDLMSASAIPQDQRPINQHWSWDRILRSCFIKQADVLQGLYFLGHLYDRETKKRNFDFYEPMTVHESSLSPCVHSVLAAELGYHDKAVDMYRRTARLDLDNLNRDTQDGLHITSMAGSWLAIAQGFAGMRTVEGLSLSPFLPKEWQGYSFQFQYRGRLLSLSVTQEQARVDLLQGEPLKLTLRGEPVELQTQVIRPL